MECIEGISASIFLSYFLYVTTIFYNLIPMFLQIIFSYFVQRKNILKTTITVFFTQGIVLSIAQFMYDIIYSICKYSSTLGFWNNILSKSFMLNILYILLLFIILIVINYLIYKNEITKKNYIKFIYLISCYLINLIAIIFIMIKFNTLFIIP